MVKQKDLPPWVHENVEAIKIPDICSKYMKALEACNLDYGQLADLCGVMIERLRQLDEDTESCGSCRFWRLPGSDEGDKTHGDCRCYTPEVIPGLDGSFRRWPVTYRMDWCGEFERKD